MKPRLVVNNDNPQRKPPVERFVMYNKSAFMILMGTVVALVAIQAITLGIFIFRLLRNCAA